MADIAVRILAADPNERGDLFARLIGNLFLALGYAEAEFNVHKAGREIDVDAVHRTESRRAIAECKAQARPVGGAALNKFMGALDAERKSAAPSQSLQGYFVSLSGFSATALQQERDAGGDRFITLRPDAVLHELVAGRILISSRQAAEQAGRLLGNGQADLVLTQDLELAMHPLGLLWIVYFSRGKSRRAFTLVHADGTVLASELAASVIARDAEVGGSLASLSHLGPDEPQIRARELSDARSRYEDYLQHEYGTITLEGLPADEHAGARSLRLEDIFVPLHLVSLAPGQGREDEPEHSEPSPPSVRGGTVGERVGIGRVLRPGARLAILASPGAGKSTLIKRLATAYADSQRLPAVEDDLPVERWLPVVLRCRQIEGLIRKPFLEIMRSIPGRAEMPDLADAFEEVVRQQLQAGSVLLLIDGLDEITTAGDRIAFAGQLRTFLATYPAVATVVTSRERGFRVIAGALATVCAPYTLAGFDDKDIEQLTVAWHANVVGSSRAVAEAAKTLAAEIVDTERVRMLAQNPLLLTTLLLVQRWIGNLPRKRSVLYGKAIEVLLATWNVEAHRPIDQEEAIPQLAFIAYAMMREGVQTLSARSLEDLLREARTEMPEILGYPRVEVGEFVERVEERSSLLVLSGHDVEDGTLRAFYEFKHLTFQEYLAAVALVEGYLSGGSASDHSLLPLLMRRLRDPAWTEVIGLALVLAGRRAAPLIEAMCADARGRARADRSTDAGDLVTETLAQALADEVLLSPDLVARASEVVARNGDRGWAGGSQIGPILSGKYGRPFKDQVIALTTSSATVDSNVAGVLGTIAYEQESLRGATLEAGCSAAIRLCREDAAVDRTMGALLIARVAYGSGRQAQVQEAASREGNAPPENINDVRSEVYRAMTDGRRVAARYLEFAACWAYAWAFGRGWFKVDDARVALPNLIEIWLTRRDASLKRWAAWAILEMPLLLPGAYVPSDKEAFGKFLEGEAGRKTTDAWLRDRAVGACVLAYYVRHDLPDELDRRVLRDGVQRQASRELANLRGLDPKQKSSRLMKPRARRARRSRVA